MTEYITPTTWEQCAAHVEAGGVVEIEDAPGVWINDRAAATSYRGRCGTPDDGWAPRRLVPGESAAPAPESSTGIGEGEAVRAYYRPTAERLRAISEVMTAERLRDEAAAPAAGDDLRERIARAAAGGYMRVPIVALDGMYLGPPWLDVADAVLAVLPAPPIDEGAGPSGPPWYLAQDVWMALGGDSNAFSAWAHCEDDRRTWGDAWAQIIAAVGGSRMEGDTNPPPGTILDLPSYQWVRESPTPPPVPPWPGAVLSGCVDEDGVPTWLAQAGQVRGEQVRGRSDFVWVNNDQMVAHLDTVWVEVRAPRPVPVPETERVPWYRAMGRTLPYGELLGDIVQAYPSADSPGGIYVEYELPERNTTGNPHRDDADGTVEVLKDGES